MHDVVDNCDAMVIHDHDLSFNPFADEGEETPTAASHSFYGAMRAETSRRRRSSVTDGEGASGVVSKAHRRAHTDTNIGQSGSATHPLKSAALRTVFQDVGVTRPRLSRIVNTGTLVDAPALDAGQVLTTSSPTTEEEKDVLIHEVFDHGILLSNVANFFRNKVTSKESLAGVSLKYGIPLPALRKANHLWPSDSIHLRKVLYIPIEHATRAQEFINEPSLISLSSESEDDGEHDNSSETSVPVQSSAIHRIPASQLSFFPPSSTASKSGSDSVDNSAETSGHHSYPNHLKPSAGNGRYGSPANNSLTSILTALPLAASTRDEIITRLSFDSVSSSYSDRSRVNSDDEGGHELNEVAERKHKHSQEDDIDTSISTSMSTLKVSHQTAVIPLVKRTTSQPPSSLRQSQHNRPMLSTSPPSSYVPHSHNPYVRTVQLEPSPAMQLPALRGSTVEHSLGQATKLTISRSVSAGKGKKRPSVIDLDPGHEMQIKLPS